MEKPKNKPSGGPGAPTTSQELATLDFYGRPLLAPRGDGGLPDISLVVVTDMLMTSALTVRELLRLGEVTENHDLAARWRDHRTPKLRQRYVEAVQALALDIVYTLRQYGLNDKRIAKTFYVQHAEFLLLELPKPLAIGLNSSADARVVFLG
jgi:hypothetical protein